MQKTNCSSLLGYFLLRRETSLDRQRFIQRVLESSRTHSKMRWDKFFQYVKLTLLSFATEMDSVGKVRLHNLDQRTSLLSIDSVDSTDLWFIWSSFEV